jgi:hypothetical protein
MPIPTPREILLDSSANASLLLEGAPVLLTEAFGVDVEEAAGMIEVAELVESPIVSIVGGAFCHRT